MTRIVTRQELIDLLLDWKEGRVEAIDVFNVGNELFDDDEKDYDDWELPGGSDNFDNNSIAHEVVCCLENLDVDLLLKEDIDAYIEILKTPIGKWKEGMKKLGEYTSKIDYEDRTKKHRHEYPCNFKTPDNMLYNKEYVEYFQKKYKNNS